MSGNKQDFLSDINRFQANHEFKHIKAGGVIFRHILCGEGKKTLTILTGGMGIAELNFSFIEKLECSYRVLAFDYPMGNDTNAELVNSVHELINKLGIEKTVFIRESYGGYLAQMIAREYPDVTEGLCLFSTAGLNQATIESLKQRYSGLAKPGIWILGHVPYNWLKPLLIKASLKKVKNVVEHITGGHLAPILQTKKYVKEIDTFMQERISV